MIYFTSDLHFYHQNVIRYCNRPFSTVEEMNEGLIARWNGRVGPDDTVYCLGDLSLAIRPVETISHRLNGEKFLVPGNHDWCHPANKKSRNDEKRRKMEDFYWQHGWNIMPLHFSMALSESLSVNVCHMPYRGDGTDGRHEKYRMEDDGRWLLCGHVHEKWKVKGRMINVGVDVWDWKPVSLPEIVQIIGEDR